MCGIAGIVGRNASDCRDAVAAMVSALGHRGPDGEGIWVAPSGRCVLGHRRLAILDLSESAAQPMIDESDRRALTYNGEIYNFRDFRKRLVAQGIRLRSRGDTEVLFRLLCDRAERILPELNGMFAFGFWDEDRARLVLARDRFGQKPLYYFSDGGRLVFASEIRALLCSGLVPKRMNRDALRGYLAYGAVQGPETILEGVRLLGPGRYLAWEREAIEKTVTYWVPGVEKREIGDGEIREELSNAVARHLVSDAPIGVFLSGGVDSSAVAAAAVRASEEKGVVSLAVVYPDCPELSERTFARRMAKHAGTDHHEVEISGSEILARLPDVLGAMDQPTMDAVNTWVVSRAARETGLKVALSGLGGDELFGGYPSFRDVPRMLRLQRRIDGLRSPLSSAARRFLGIRGEKLAEMLCADDLVGVYLARRRLFTRAGMERIAPGLSDAGRDHDLPAELSEELREMTGHRKIPDAVGILEMFSYMNQVLLRDSDVMGMSFGLEIRMPFLDAEFSRLVMDADASVRIPGRVAKHALIRAMGDWILPEVASRRKMGFTMPFADWMRKELRGEVRSGLEFLSESRLGFDGDAMIGLWTRFLEDSSGAGWARPWSLYVLSRYIREQALAT